MAATEELGLEVFVEGWKKFENILDKLDKKVGTTGESMTKTGGIAGGAFAVALGNVATLAVETLIRALVKAGEAVIAFGVDSVKMAADFQSQMVILEVAASSTGLSFDQLHDAALAVGGDISLLGVSATGAADSMTGLFKAGLTNVEVFGDLEGYMAGTAELGGALRASIDLAAASELDMVQASDLAAITLASFGGELETETERANFINKAMNNFVQAADASVASVSSLAEGLRTVGPVASGLGISLEDTNNALAVLSTRGIEGANAGTMLKSMLTNMQRPTGTVKKAWDELGISIFDAEGVMRDIPDIIGDMNVSMADYTDEQKNLIVQQIAGTYGMNAMNTLLAEGQEGWNAMAEATENAAGIQEVATARSKTFNAQMEAMEGTVETLKIGIGEQFLPVATEMVEWFAEMVDEHGPALQAIFEAVANAVEQFFGDLTSGQGVLATTVEWLGEKLPIAIGILKTFWEETWPGIRDVLLEVWEQVEPVLLAIGEWLRDEGPAALTSAGESFQGFRDVLTEVWTFIQELVEKVVVWFQENLPLITEQAEMVATHFQENLLLMQEAGQALANFWEYVIVPALDNVWEIIKTIVSTALDVILNFITFSMQVMQGDWEGAWTTVKDTASTIWEAIQTIISEFIEGVANAVGTTTEEIKETWETNWEMVKTIVTTIWGNMVTAITEKLNEIVGVVSTKIESVKTTIEGYVGTFSSVGASLMEGLKSGIISKVQSIIDAVKKAVQDAIQAAKDALDWGSPSKVFAELGRSTMEGMALGVAQLAPVVQQQITAAITPVARPGGVVEGAHTEITDNRQFNLNTTTTMRPGGLAMEFTRFEMASR